MQWEKGNKTKQKKHNRVTGTGLWGDGGRLDFIMGSG